MKTDDSMDPPWPQRRRPAHPPPVFRFNQPVLIMVTACTEKRRPILARAAAVAVLRSAWQAAPSWLVFRWVVMPDHVHLLVAPQSEAGRSLSRWMRQWKADCARRWPDRADLPLWQRSYWDRQVRSGESFSAAWAYVRKNPVRAGLVKDPDEWPFQGVERPFLWDGR